MCAACADSDDENLAKYCTEGLDGNWTQGPKPSGAAGNYLKGAIFTPEDERESEPIFEAWFSSESNHLLYCRIFGDRSLSLGADIYLFDYDSGEVRSSNYRSWFSSR